MSEITVPRTPSPASKGPNSPPAISSSDLTPPPSTQAPRGAPSTTLHETQLEYLPRLASPPATTRQSPRRRQEHGSFKAPTLEEARGLSNNDCRELVQELIPALGEARMALAHSKLQLNLLTIESAESAQRAEAEHDLTRREVEVLQTTSPTLRSRSTLYPDPRSQLAQVQRHLDSSIQHGRELEAENHQLQHRLKDAKKVIRHMDSQVSTLKEDNRLLRERIRQNREHFNEIRASASQAATTTTRSNTDSPQRHRAAPINTGRTRKGDPLDALLMADEVLNGRADPSSVPATPSPYRASKYNASRTRGTHSLSSLPSTPTRTRPISSDELLRTPINQIIQAPHANFSSPTSHSRPKTQLRQREDRDSTISASEDEAVTDEELPASQASQAASSMLRRYPGTDSQGSPREHQEKLVQTKLLGSITKSFKNRQTKRTSRNETVSDEEQTGRAAKRNRVNTGEQDIGLGIGMWPSPKR